MFRPTKRKVLLGAGAAVFIVFMLGAINGGKKDDGYPSYMGEKKKSG
jgi:hypothetical protein